jgi:hypothetical protein
MCAAMQADYDYWWSSDHWYNSSLDECGMNFRLIYRGPLATIKSATPRHKHFIRQNFQLQLSVLWNTVPFIESIGRMHVQKERGSRESLPLVEKLAEEHRKGNFRFVPLVCRDLGLACSLEVLCLRREEPGEPAFGGDLDNRFKVLVDALKIPNDNDLRGIEPEEGEDPFFCLLEDDFLLTDFQVKSDRLLIPSDFPMSHKIMQDAAGNLYERFRQGEIPDREKWDELFREEIGKECERQRSEKEIWMVIKVKLLAANPGVDNFYMDFVL